MREFKIKVGKFIIDRSYNSKKEAMNNPLTPEQEAEARYPVASDDYVIDCSRRAFIAGAEWRDEQSKKNTVFKTDLAAKVEDIYFLVDNDRKEEALQFLKGLIDCPPTDCDKLNDKK